MRKRLAALTIALAATFGGVIAVAPAAPAAAASFIPFQYFMSWPRWTCYGDGRVIYTNGVGAYSLWNAGFDCRRR